MLCRASDSHLVPRRDRKIQAIGSGSVWLGRHDAVSAMIQLYRNDPVASLSRAWSRHVGCHVVWRVVTGTRHDGGPNRRKLGKEEGVDVGEMSDVWARHASAEMSIALAQSGEAKLTLTQGTPAVQRPPSLGCTPFSSRGQQQQTTRRPRNVLSTLPGGVPGRMTTSDARSAFSPLPNSPTLPLP